MTPFGRFLRRTKINELPQLLNVLKGDMTFVGPRPEAPDLAALYPPHAWAIFTVTPGVVGPNQILGRNEEEWYPPDVDPQQYYIEEILPKKLPLDLEYVRHPSLFKDLQYLVLGIKETVCKALSWKLVLQNRSQIYMLGLDFVLCIVSFGLAHVLCALSSCRTRTCDAPCCTWYRLWCWFVSPASCTLGSIAPLSVTYRIGIYGMSCKAVSTSSMLFLA